MTKLTLRTISYKDLKEYKYKLYDDPYGITAFMTDHLRETLLACPNNDDDSKTAMYLMLDDNIAVARELQFCTKIQVDKEVISAQAGASLYVVDSYRTLGIGAEILLAAKMSKDYDFKINSLFSKMVVPMYKKMKYTFYDIPQYVFICNTRPYLESRGVRGTILSICTFITNIPIHAIKFFNKIKRKKLLQKYIVSKETLVPQWAEDMVLNDSHKYMELHNQEWLQWNLDYNYNGFSGDKQSFYAIYDKHRNPKGFFMTKERFEENAGLYHNTIRGTIVEWASIDSELKEIDINILALSTFSSGTFLVHTVTTDNTTAKKLKNIGFRRHGMLQMNIFDKSKKYDDIDNINLWRIRYGCCNTIIFGEDRILYN